MNRILNSIIMAAVAITLSSCCQKAQAGIDVMPEDAEYSIKTLRCEL